MLLGGSYHSWLSDWGFLQCAVCEPSLDELSAAWNTGVRCLGISVDFTPPPCDPGPLLDFEPRPLRHHRECCAWTRQLLRVFCCLYRTATLGRPARLQIPAKPASFEPIATWVRQSIAVLEDSDAPCTSLPSCFTLEFSLL